MGRFCGRVCEDWLGSRITSGGVHRSPGWVAVAHAEIFEEIFDVRGLMHPQFFRCEVASHLSAEVLFGRAQVFQTEFIGDFALHPREELRTIAPPHAVVDV